MNRSYAYNFLCGMATAVLVSVGIFLVMLNVTDHSRREQALDVTVGSIITAQHIYRHLDVMRNVNGCYSFRPALRKFLQAKMDRYHFTGDEIGQPPAILACLGGLKSAEILSFHWQYDPDQAGWPLPDRGRSL